LIRNVRKSVKGWKDLDLSLFPMKTSVKYFGLAVGPRPGNMSQTGKKLLHLRQHSQKICSLQPKKFWVQTRRRI